MVVAATSELRRSSSSSSSSGSSSGDERSRHEKGIVSNEDLKEKHLDAVENGMVQYGKIEVNGSEHAQIEIVEDKMNDLEGEGQARNSILEESTNLVKGKEGKKHIQFGIEGDESKDEEEEVETEEVELEFENVVPKLHTHNAYCPNCDAQITKVILRRRIPKKILTPSTSNQHPKEEGRELVGCLSCFSIFVPKANKLDPFPIFGGADDSGASSHLLQSVPRSTSEEIGCDPFAMFRRKQETGSGKLSQPIKEETTLAPQEGDRTSLSGGGESVARSRKQGYETLPLPSVNSEDISHLSLNIPDFPGNSGHSLEPLLPITEVQSDFPEIVKSIVYGGLAESITSLTVVSSAVASGAATLSIVALGLANLIGGGVVLAQNLSNLKNDQQEEKYKEALGRKEHFLVHAIIAVISYLVFGLIPPIFYGFTFQETDDKDFKLLAMAAASLICIFFLAIGKAYIAQPQLHKFITYLNFVVYYLATAALASGVGYGVGDKAKTFLENFGWFHYPKDQATSTSLFFHGSQTLDPSFGSY